MTQNPKRHIALCGFMASGKSTLGLALADLLQWPFTDLDKHIEKVKGFTVPEIFKKHGEKYFRDAEEQALESVLKARPRVIGLGGGTICNQKNLSLAKSKSLLIYIEVPQDELFIRLSNDKSRPLVSGADEPTLRKFISETLASRRKFYTQAHLTVDGTSLDAARLRNIIEAYEKDNS